jgi:regulator of sirC expression with transglutaminase-like and TPR domain
MIDEPDPVVYEKIADSIAGFGSAAIPVLEKVSENSFDPFILERLEDLIEKIHFDGILNDITRWKGSENHDLLQLMQILSKFHFRSTDMVAFNNRITEMQREIWLELNENLTSLECVRLVNHFMFRSWGFSNDSPGLPEPGNFFLSKVLEGKKAHPLTLGVLYLGLCQRLTLPVFYVGLPDNFILAYTNQVRFNPLSDPGEILFYINPLLEGVIFNRKEIDRFLKTNNMPPQPEYYQAFDNLRVAALIVSVIKDIYERNDDQERILAVNRMAQILS